MIKVSILMNGYNSEKYLVEAIDSIYNQTFKDWEIIFIDNCSTDSTKKIVDSYDEKIRYYKTNTNIPLGEARNFGLSKCNKEYIAFLDTDDIWFSDKLQQQVTMLDKDLKLQMCYGGVKYIDELSHKIGESLPEAKTGHVFSQQLKRYEINMQTVLIRNNINIIFNSNMQFSPDFDLFMKISSEYEVAVIDDFLAKYRKLSNSLTSKTISRWGIETEETLNNIFSLNPNLKLKYPREYTLAYAKVGYYYAQYYVSVGQMKKARLALVKNASISFEYRLLYFLSYFPSSFWNFIHRFK